MKTQDQAKKNTDQEITQTEYVDRLRAIQTKIGALNYRTLYEYEYNEKLTEQGVVSLRNFWAFRNNDTKFLNRFEYIAENIKRIPEVAKK